MHWQVGPAELGFPGAESVLASRSHLASGHSNSVINKRFQDLELHIGLGIMIKELFCHVGEPHRHRGLTCGPHVKPTNALVERCDAAGLHADSDPMRQLLIRTLES
jgi:hypothetical protein